MNPTNVSISATVWKEQLRTLESGNVQERAIAASVLKRVLTNMEETMPAGVEYRCDVTNLYPDINTKSGWSGVAASDEFYTCCHDVDVAAVSIVIRNRDQKPIRSLVMVMSHALNKELFGGVNSMVYLNNDDVPEVKQKELHSDTTETTTVVAVENTKKNETLNTNPVQPVKSETESKPPVPPTTIPVPPANPTVSAPKPIK